MKQNIYIYRLTYFLNGGQKTLQKAYISVKLTLAAFFKLRKWWYQPILAP